MNMNKARQQQLQLLLKNEGPLEDLVRLRAELESESKSSRPAPIVCEMIASIEEKLGRLGSASTWLRKKCELAGHTTQADRKRLGLWAMRLRDAAQMPLPQPIAHDLFDFLGQCGETSSLSRTDLQAVTNWLRNNLNSLALADAAIHYFKQQSLETDDAVYWHLQSTIQSVD